jgi:hypothetical protein
MLVTAHEIASLVLYLFLMALLALSLSPLPVALHFVDR